jgi:transposase
MRLNDWIKNVGVSGAARQLNVSRQCIYNWLNARRTHRKGQKTRIARATKGKVEYRHPRIPLKSASMPLARLAYDSPHLRNRVEWDHQV